MNETDPAVFDRIACYLRKNKLDHAHEKLVNRAPWAYAKAIRDGNLPTEAPVEA